MASIHIVFLGAAITIMFGFFAEFLFRKTRIPDILLLLLFGFLIGPYGGGYVTPEQLVSYAPLFTSFALLFLLFEGAFNIDLGSLARGVTKSITLTLFNFIISSICIFIIMLLFRFDPYTSILTGFILGGISSAFVIPLLKQLRVGSETYSILTLESAITDVLCIVTALTTLEIISVQTFSAQSTLSSIMSIFAVAGAIGIIAGIIWIVLTLKIFQQHRSYMMTIAYVVLVYSITEMLNGNGAISSLFLGIVIRNSKQLIHIFEHITRHEPSGTVHKKKQPTSAIAVTSPAEEFFYSQISFFLKTFFFVYIGIVLSLSDRIALIIGLSIAIALLIVRNLSSILTRRFPAFDRAVINSIFARGLAAAAIAQFVVQAGIPHAETISHITYAVIGSTIILSSIRVFIVQQLESKIRAKQ